MMNSIENRSGRREQRRIESLRASLDDLVERGAKASQGPDGKIAPLYKLFAYGFGFGGLLTIFSSEAVPEVQDLLRLPGASSSTIGIDRLAEDWRVYRGHVEAMSKQMFGGTPMVSALRIAKQRILEELSSANWSDPPIVFLLSDGEPTDGPPEEVMQAAEELKSEGVFVVSCLLTSEDLTEPRRLYNRPSPAWPSSALLMFECASILPAGSPFEAYMLEYRWRTEPQSRLFTQINQSEVLSEFLKVVLSPLDGEKSKAGQPDRDHVRVFVTYSHQDAKFLGKDSLLGFLSSLQREGFSFWTDEEILSSEQWDRRIREEMGRTDIVLALVSQAFLNSPYCQDVEMASFLEARRDLGTKIFPIIVSPCDWKSHGWLASTQFQPRGSKTIERDYTNRGKRDELFLSILEELRILGREI
jgi:hypothetical protein